MMDNWVVDALQGADDCSTMGVRVDGEGLTPKNPRKTLAPFGQVRERKPLKELVRSTPLLGTTLKNNRAVLVD
jgi:hypothetical protein